jgi:hypothetical protein
MFRAILNFLRGYDTRYSELELRLFEGLSKLLSHDDQGKLKNRLSKIGKICRLDGGREIIFYQYKNGKVVFPRETSISDVVEITKFVEFRIFSSSEMTANKGSILLKNGNLGIIKYIRPIEHAEVDDIISIEMKIVDEPYDDDEDLR